MMVVARDIASAQSAGARHLLFHCGALRAWERALVICDHETLLVARFLRDEARRSGCTIDLIEIPPLFMHGMEPDAVTTAAMRTADLILGLTAKSMAHTKARLDACNDGARYLSLPEYSLNLLAAPCLLIDYRDAGADARRVADAFSYGHSVWVTSRAGTDIRFDIAGRTGNCCPGYVEHPGELGSPPDVEANISPIEDSSEGMVIVDGSIPHPLFGLLTSPLYVSVSGGRIKKIEGDPEVVTILERLFDSADPFKTKVLAECGVGLNREAELSGIMLTDEGAYGTMHFGFGSNATVGGINNVPFHLDFVFRSPTLVIDDSLVIDCGRLVL